MPTYLYMYICSTNYNWNLYLSNSVAYPVLDYVEIILNCFCFLANLLRTQMK